MWEGDHEKCHLNQTKRGEQGVGRWKGELTGAGNGEVSKRKKGLQTSAAVGKKKDRWEPTLMVCCNSGVGKHFDFHRNHQSCAKIAGDAPRGRTSDVFWEKGWQRN